MTIVLGDLSVAVVLVTFNRADMLRANLKSLSKQGALTYFIIDNNSSDYTSEVVSNFAGSTTDTVFYFNTQANLGGAGGFAFGCEKVLEHSQSFSHIWFTDDDVVFSDDCLTQLSRYVDHETILQPMRFAPDGSNAEASAITIDLESVFILNHKRDSVMSSPYVDWQEPFDIQNIPFEGPLIPISIFNKIGIPDRRFFIFSDDLDFSLRALNAGFNIKCIPSAQMTRLRPDKISYNPKDWRSYFVYRNFFRIQKTYGANFFVRYRPYLLALLVVSYSLVTGNFKGVSIIRDALSDGMSEDFKLNASYIPGKSTPR